MTTELVRYDEACRALAQAKAIDEVKEIHDKATALKAYARLAKNRQLEVDAAEIRLRSERRLGEMIAEQRVTVGLNRGGRPSKTAIQQIAVSERVPTLQEMDIGNGLAMRARKLAAVPEEKFEGMLADWRKRAFQRLLTAPTALERRVAGGEFTRLIRERNAQRSAGTIAAIEKRRGLR